MNTFKSTAYFFMAILLALALSACDTGKKDDAETKDQKTSRPMTPDDRISLEKQVNELRQALTLSADETNFLNAKAAICDSGYQTGGYFTNMDGMTGYFSNYPKPFNFYWTGNVVTRTGIDGRQYKMMDGHGELIVKYMDQPMALQRYRGNLKNGIWEGFGVYYSSQDDGGTQQSGIVYEGEFVHDHMQGKAVYSFYNLEDIDEEMFRYEGSMYADQFSGYGTWTSLNTGIILMKGFFLDGIYFEGNERDWKISFEEELKNNPAHQIYNVIALSEHTPTVDPMANDDQTLTILAPENAEDLIIQTGQKESLPIIDLEQNVQTQENPQVRINKGARLELPLRNYPVELFMSFNLNGKDNHLSFTVRNPAFIRLVHNAQQEQ